jgi:nitric oxide reductase large subunit
MKLSCASISSNTTNTTHLPITPLVVQPELATTIIMSYFTTLICLALIALIALAAYHLITRPNTTHDRILRPCARKFPKQRVTIKVLGEDVTWWVAYLLVDGCVVANADECTSEEQALTRPEGLVFSYGK